MALLNSISSSLTGMKVAQSQLEIISNNIANVDTKGYTRKTAAQSAIVVAGQSMGVRMENATRTVDENLLKNYLSSNAKTSSLSAESNYLNRMDNLMGTTADSNSLSYNVGNLQTALETFATTVSSSASRYNLLTGATEMTNKLNYLASNIQTLRGDADQEISGAVNTVNSLLNNIDSLNTDIIKYTVLNRDGVANLQDQRDTALRELSSYLDVTYYTRESGQVVIYTTSGVPLLDNQVYELSHSSLAKVGADNSYDSGNIQGIYVDGKDITSSIRDGSISGLINVRDNILPSLQGQLDELSYALYNEMNSIHNQGTAYPNMPSQLVGSKTFISPEQKIALGSESDVRFIVFDSDGNQVATSTLLSEIGFPQNGGTLSVMMDKIKTWLQDEANLEYADVYFNSDKHLVIDTGDSNYTLSIVDEKTSTVGSEQDPATINFSADGDDNYEQTYSGFSEFFGLNNFFSNNMNDYILDSKIVNPKAAVGVNGVTTWNFSDSVNGLNYASIEISRTSTIQEIADKINNNDVLNERNIKASLIKNGEGYMLRIESLEGAQLAICEQGTTGVLDKLNMKVSSCGYASNISVREDIVQNVNLIACGSPQYDSNKGVYSINSASNNIANKMAATMSSDHTFKQAGNMATTTTTIANYASTFVGNVSSLANTAESSFEYQNALTSAISDKEAKFSGIDLDEELAQMIIYQQSYAACAQVFTASREILDTLLSMV